MGLPLLLLLAPGAARAGTFYVSEHPAKVVSAEQVVGYVLEDPFAQFKDPKERSSDPFETDSRQQRVTGLMGHLSGMGAGMAQKPQHPRLVHRKARVCRVRVNVGDRWFRRANPISLYGSPALCERVKAGDAIHVQNFGIVDLYRLVSIRLGEEWFRLPLMRETRSTLLRDCLEGTAPPPKSKKKKEEEDEPDLCGQMSHPRTL